MASKGHPLILSNSEIPSDMFHRGLSARITGYLSPACHSRSKITRYFRKSQNFYDALAPLDGSDRWF